MKAIESYKISDGRIFDTVEKAEAAENDIIGAELDELVHRIMCMDPGHQAIYKGVLSALKRKTELLYCVKRIVAVIEFAGDE
jgi:hypothetical protein